MNPTKIKIKDEIYPINTSYKVALECNKIATDTSIGDYEKALAIIYKLFGEKGLSDTQNHEQLIKMGQKFLLLNKEYNSEKSEPDFDYEEDFPYISASFMSDYKIDLDAQDMHWWTFYNLLNGLSNSEFGNCCILNRIRNLRRMDTSKIKDTKLKQEIEKAKREVALNKTKKIDFNEQQIANINKFKRLAGID